MQTLRNLFYVLVIGFGLSILYIRSKSIKGHLSIENINTNYKFTQQPDTISDKSGLNYLVYTISTIGVLEGRIIGIEGRISTQPNYLERLKQLADTNQLVQLTDHSDPLVRTLAFKALRDKRYSGLKKIFDKHLYDSETYQYHSGCMIEPIPVNADLYSCIYPFLSKSEAKWYEIKLLKKYKGTFYEHMFWHP